MPEVKWIKITTNMFEDEKIDFIDSLPESDTILIIWVRLLTLAGKCNAGGYIMLTENIAYTDEMLAHKFRRPINVVRMALETFKRLGMIHEADSNALIITNWPKHQNAEALDAMREYNRHAKRKERERKQLPPSDICQANVNDNNMTCPRSQDTDIDKDIGTVYILEFWNSKKIVNHSKTEKMEKAINKALKEYSKSLILQAIDNYNSALKDESYFYSHIWRLDKFLSQSNGLPDFLEDGQQWINYKNQNRKKGGNSNGTAYDKGNAQGQSANSGNYAGYFG